MKDSSHYKWRFGEILVMNGWITWEQLEKALEIQKRNEKIELELQGKLVQMGAVAKDKGSALNLGEVLVKHGWLSWEHLSRGLRIQKETNRMIGEILLTEGYVTERNLYQGLAIQVGKTFVDIEKVTIPPESIRLVPKHIVAEYQIMPLLAKDRVLLLAISKPNDLRAEEKIQVLLPDHEIRPVIACPSKIRDAIVQYYGQS